MDSAQLKMKPELLARRAAKKSPWKKKSQCAHGVGDAACEWTERNKGGIQEVRYGQQQRAAEGTASSLDLRLSLLLVVGGGGFLPREILGVYGLRFHCKGQLR